MAEKEVDLGNHRDLVKAHAAAIAKRKFHEAEAAKYDKVAKDIAAKALSKVFGDATEGYLDGRLVLRRVETSQFASARFAKEHPDLAKQFETAEVVYKIDVDNLEKAEPDLFKSYLTTRWYNDLED